MSDLSADSGPYQPIPFVPGLFYAIPLQWLADVCETGDLDTRQLLLAMNNGTDNLVTFAPEQGEAYWTRSNPEHLPNVVSHPTYLRYRNALIDHGLLQVLEPASQSIHVYVLAGWPRFDHRGLLFVPRAHIRHRWPAWLGQGQWAPRAALLALFAKMTAEKTGTALAAGRPLEVTAYVKELRQRAQEILPAAHISAKVGSGLSQLADLGLINEIARSRSNRCYRLSADALDRTPTWPLTEIAARCELDPIRDAPWLTVIQAFLRYNFWPVTRSHEVWAAIRRYASDSVTHDAAQAIGRLLEQRAARPGLSRAAIHPRVVLKDYVAQQRRPWRHGAEFGLTLVNGAASERKLWLPVSSPANLDATQLMVSPTWEGRLRREDVLAMLQDTRWFVRQPRAPYVEQLIELPLPLRPDRHAFTDGLFLEGNHLHTTLDYTVPFQVILEAPQAQPKLSLRCQFRVLLGRTAAVERQGA
jgi:hypothetical protein